MENTPPNVLHPVFEGEPLVFKLNGEFNTVTVTAEDADRDRLEFYWDIPASWNYTIDGDRDGADTGDIPPRYWSAATIYRDESYDGEEFSVMVTDREDNAFLFWVVEVF